MGVFDAAFDSIEGMLADQWKDIVTAGPFDEHVVVAPGIRKRSQNGNGANMGAEDVLSNGSYIFVPENTAAFIFSKAGIEQVITQPGGFEFRGGEASVFDEQDRREQGMGKILIDQAWDRLGFSGMSSDEFRVAFINLREIRGVKFGTRGALVYHDGFYGADLELFAYGSMALKVTDPVAFVRNFLPPNASSYTFDDPGARSQLISELLHSLMVATNELSTSLRISQLPAHADDIRARILGDADHVGSWQERFGISLTSIALENIELPDESRELVHRFSERRMDVLAYQDISQHAANVAAQQLIAQGVRDNGLGDAGGMLFGMNLADGLNPTNAASAAAPATPAPQQTSPASQETAPSAAAPEASATAHAAPSLDEQIATLQRFKELLDAGILTQDEFDRKKREILGF